MDIEIKNIHKYDSNYYQGIEIHEFTGQHKFLVKFYGRDVWFDSNLVGGRASDDLDGLAPVDKIRRIVRNYLDSVIINKFTGTFISKSIHGVICFEAIGTRCLTMNVRSSDLMLLIDDIHNKYRQDRYNFCYSNDSIKAFRINTADFSSYHIVDDKLCFHFEGKEPIINLCLKHDSRGVTLPSEQEFIKQFIMDKVSKYDEEIKTFKVADYKGHFKGYLLICGDIRIYFPYYHELLWIFDIVNEYNNELRKVKENIKKRQLKMEEF